MLLGVVNLRRLQGLPLVFPPPAEGALGEQWDRPPAALTSLTELGAGSPVSPSSSGWVPAEAGRAPHPVLLWVLRPAAPANLCPLRALGAAHADLKGQIQIPSVLKRRDSPALPSFRISGSCPRTCANLPNGYISLWPASLLRNAPQGLGASSLNCNLPGDSTRLPVPGRGGADVSPDLEQSPGSFRVSVALAGCSAEHRLRLTAHAVIEPSSFSSTFMERCSALRRHLFLILFPSRALAGGGRRRREESGVFPLGPGSHSLPCPSHLG